MTDMTAKEIIELQRIRPFPGLRITISDGQTYEVGHPELMTVGRRMLFIALAPGADGVPEQHVYCDPVHVTRIELMNGPSQGGSPVE